MLDVFFFTTNRTKLAHLRYLGQKHGINVRGFHQATYRASYTEPRIDDRQKLLDSSYESALQQWKRSGLDDGNTIFFLEDTSVRIEALSRRKEVPGVNVKFWMKDMTFSRLDSLLKNQGNNREVTVRSDIVAHLPDRFRKILNLPTRYLWVVGETNGSIVESEGFVTPNVLYPWLDDRSFNRWFVPEGEKSPISVLSIEQADAGDFRAKAFGQVIETLSKLQLIHKEAKAPKELQLELPKIGTPPSMFVICGPTCAGKTTIASWLSEKYGVPHIEASDFMYKAFRDRHGRIPRFRVGDFAEAALKDQPDIVAGPLAKHIRAKGYSSAIVTGFRAPGEIDSFKRELESDNKIEVIFLDAQHDLRLVRALARNRERETPEKFEARCAQEQRMGLGLMTQLLDVTKIDNNGTKAALNREFERRYKSAFLVMQRTRPSKLDRGLEPLILLTLLHLKEDEKWATTTEIAHELNSLFAQRKSKNNVSRYFNQEFHPYFDIRPRVVDQKESRTVEYQLSPTGVSEAKRLAQIPEITNQLPKTIYERLNNQLRLPMSED